MGTNPFPHSRLRNINIYQLKSHPQQQVQFICIFICSTQIQFWMLYSSMPHDAQIPYPSTCDVELLVTAFTLSNLLVWGPLSIPFCNIPRCFLSEVCNLELWYAQLITKLFQCLFLFSALFLQLIVFLLQRHIFLPRDITISNRRTLYFTFNLMHFLFLSQ